jgi:XTP/dITP diphosphohydrolase
VPKLLLATNNGHKLAEYREILEELALELVSPLDLGLELDPAETGVTFEENAVIKAQAFAAASGLPVLADDSGLEVDALHGAPGIYSARYGNTAKNDHPGRCRLVLQKLADLPWEARTARFRCVIAVATPETVIGTVDGRVEGYINYDIRGENGFGYDPIFYVPDFEANLAEVTAAQKHAISHRGRAARAAIPLITQLG